MQYCELAIALFALSVTVECPNVLDSNFDFKMKIKDVEVWMKIDSKTYLVNANVLAKIGTSRVQPFVRGT